MRASSQRPRGYPGRRRTATGRQRGCRRAASSDAPSGARPATRDARAAAGLAVLLHQLDAEPLWRDRRPPRAQLVDVQALPTCAQLSPLRRSRSLASNAGRTRHRAAAVAHAAPRGGLRAVGDGAAQRSALDARGRLELPRRDRAVDGIARMTGIWRPRTRPPRGTPRRPRGHARARTGSAACTPSRSRPAAARAAARRRGGGRRDAPAAFRRAPRARRRLAVEDVASPRRYASCGGS